MPKNAKKTRTSPFPLWCSPSNAACHPSISCHTSKPLWRGRSCLVLLFRTKTRRDASFVLIEDPWRIWRWIAVAQFGETDGCLRKKTKRYPQTMITWLAFAGLCWPKLGKNDEHALKWVAHVFWQTQHPQVPQGLGQATRWCPSSGESWSNKHNWGAAPPSEKRLQKKPLLHQHFSTLCLKNAQKRSHFAGFSLLFPRPFSHHFAGRTFASRLAWSSSSLPRDQSGSARDRGGSSGPSVPGRPGGRHRKWLKG